MSRDASGFKRFVLLAYVAFLGIETGGGLFTTAVVFPVWTASPEIVVGWRPEMPYFMQEGDFFMYTSSATTLLALLVAVMSRRLPIPVRPWALGSSLSFLLIAVWTGAYFIPVQARMHGDGGAARPRAELAGMLERFVTLNYVRQAILVVAFLAAIHALGLLYGNTLPDASRRASVDVE